MTEFERPELRATLTPDEYCCMCGADTDTDKSLVSGWLDVLIVTPAAGGAVKKLCNTCLGWVLGTVFSHAGHAALTRMGEAAIRNQAAPEPRRE